MFVKKNHQDTSFSLDTKLDKNIELDKVKTTNVNILLNRVRLDKKKVLRKRIIFSTVLVSLVSSLAIYFIA